MAERRYAEEACASEFMDSDIGFKSSRGQRSFQVCGCSRTTSHFSCRLALAHAPRARFKQELNDGAGYEESGSAGENCERRCKISERSVSHAEGAVRSPEAPAASHCDVLHLRRLTNYSQHAAANRAGRNLHRAHTWKYRPQVQ